MSAASSSPYADSDDIIAHLKTVSANSNSKSEACPKYHKLKMKPRDSYADFIAEFLLLTDESYVIEENR
jgi:hypothetical protein